MPYTETVGLADRESMKAPLLVLVLGSFLGCAPEKREPTCEEKWGVAAPVACRNKE